MKLRTERRLFQLVVLIAAIVPISAGAAGVLFGDAMVGTRLRFNANLDSHFRYLSGLLLGIGIAYVIAVRRIERNTELFTALSLIVILAGTARVAGVLQHGLPAAPHQLAIIMEVGVVPLLLLWLYRIRRRTREWFPCPTAPGLR